MMHRYRECMLFFARCSAMLMLYGVSASMALANIGTVLVLTFWLLSWEWSRSWVKLTKLPVFWPLILLPSMVIVGTIFSIAPIEYAYRYLGVYSRFFIILIIVSLIGDERWQFRFWIAFFIGAFLTLALTYLGVWFTLPWSISNKNGWTGNYSVFYDYIVQGVMTCFLAVVSLSHFLTETGNRRKFFWLFSLLLSVYSITHLLIGRTGQVVCLIALTGTIIIALPKRQAFIACAALLLAGAFLTSTSPVIHERFQLLLSEVRMYKLGEQYSSIGARLAMWSSSISFIIEQPVWGHGTGSYRWLAEKVFTDSLMCLTACIHPHNQFFFFGVEHGLLGLFLYGWLLFSIFKVAKQVERRHSLTLMGLLIIITVDSCINSPFWISGQRNFYTAALGLTLASFYLNSKNTSNSTEA